MRQTVGTGAAILFAAVFAANLGVAQSSGASKPEPSVSGPAVVDPGTSETARAPEPARTPDPAIQKPSPEQSPKVTSGAGQNSPLNTPPPSAPPRAKKGKKSDNDKDETSQAAPQPDDKPYVIGSLDVIEVRVWDNAKLTGMYDVQPDGMISMPLVGQLKADGLTVPEMTKVLKTKLTEYLDDPEVNVQVVKYNSKKYTVIGGCARQGETPLIAKTTVLDALANCGGFREFANLKKIKIYRGNQKFDFNYKDALQNKHPEQNIYLQNGDRIVIPE